jgi:glucokinase
MILAGDVGGTKFNLGAFENQQGKLHLIAKQRYSSHLYTRAEDAIADFVRQLKSKVTAACFDVAGPVVDNTVHATNLPWVMDGAGLAKFLGIPRVRLLNDLEATGYGLEVLEPNELEVLQAGVPTRAANRAVIAAGTGLGEAVLFWNGQHHVPYATEGGHTGFAVQNNLEVELAQAMLRKYGQLEYEMLLSGRGFREIHDFLDPSVRHPVFETAGADPAPEITKNAVDGICPICVRAVEIWIDIYGAEAGNLALHSLARGGVFVAGGIAVKILPLLKRGNFVRAFAEKPKLGELLARIPISVVLNEDAPMLGSAYVASLDVP